MGLVTLALHLIAQVFQFKKKLLYLIKSDNIFGQFYRHIYTTKYQKRGLPYMRLFILLNSADKFLKTFHINEIIYTKLLTIMLILLVSLQEL